MSYFIGTYECKIDAKGRVLLPSALKKQLSVHLKEGFIIKRSVFNQCLELYSTQEWKKQMSEINNLNRFNKKNIEFIRCFTSGVKQIDIDTTGRILIPRDLIKHVAIEKEIVISSSINILEIWSKSYYEKTIKNTAENFEKLAEEVMGDKQNVS